MTELLTKLRLAELEASKGWFSPGLRVLEIGGGNGFQARTLAGWGCNVLSLDLPERPFPPPYLFPVQDYDGVHVPAADETFDRVFSSNVLEHVRDLPALLAETRRVLKPDGLCIHILPTPAWRLWTSLAHYPALYEVYLRPRWHKDAPARAANASQVAAVAQPRSSLWRRLGRVMLAGAHGEYPNAPAELYYFSRRRWLRVFAENGFTVRQVRGGGLFYTGYGLRPSLTVERRGTLARWLGAATRAYVMTKADL